MSDIVKVFTKCFLIILLVKLPTFLMCYNFNYTLHGDDAAYTFIAHTVGKDFFTSSYPWGLPMFIKLFDYNFSIIIIFQFILSAFAWTFPFYYFSLCVFSNRISLIGKILIIILVASLGITSWDSNILTESLTFSLLVISLSMVYSIHRYGCSISKILLFTLSSMICITIRDSNFLVIFYALAFLLLTKNVQLVMKVAVSILIFGMTYFMMSTAHEIRQKIHYGDMLVGYIYVNDKYAPDYLKNTRNDEFYQWYINNTKIPDLRKEYYKCLESLNNNAVSQSVPYYDYLVQQNKPLKEIVFEPCFPAYNQDMYNYLNSPQVSTDYAKFLLAHPLFIVFGSLKYVPNTRLLIFPTMEIENGGHSLILSLNIWLKRILLHLYSLSSLVLLFFIIKNAYSDRTFRYVYFVGIFIPSWVFAEGCFLAEPLNLNRHCLAGAIYLLVGGFYVLLFYQRLDKKLN